MFLPADQERSLFLQNVPSLLSSGMVQSENTYSSLTKFTGQVWESQERASINISNYLHQGSSTQAYLSFFISYLAATWSALSNWQGESHTHAILITTHFLIWPGPLKSVNTSWMIDSNLTNSIEEDVMQDRCRLYFCCDTINRNVANYSVFFSLSDD